jgi:hypothetical protein
VRSATDSAPKMPSRDWPELDSPTVTASLSFRAEQRSARWSLTSRADSCALSQASVFCAHVDSPGLLCEHTFVYAIFSPGKPHVALATAATIDSIAVTLASRRDSKLTVCVNQDGLTRPLNDAEQRELAERVRELRPLTGESGADVG